MSSSGGRPTKSSSGGSRVRLEDDPSISNGLGTGSKSRTATVTQRSKTIEAVPTTPTSSSSNIYKKISMSSAYLPYQYKREAKIPSRVAAQLPSRTLSPTHRPTRLGLGSAVGNLRVFHIINSKKASIVVNGERRRLIPGSLKKDQSQSVSASKKITPGGDSGASVTSRMKMLTIYESPKASGGDCPPEASTSCRINPTASVTGKVFLTLNKKANYLAALDKKVIFTLGSGTSFTVQPGKRNNEEESHRAISNLCRHFRNILGWKLSIHLSWKYAEEKIQSWYSTTQPPNRLSVEEIGALLKVPADKIRNFEFDPEMEHIFTLLRKNLSHTAFPSFAKLLTLQGIQKGEDQSVSRFVAEHCGMYLESEIVDKHLTFIRRNEEMKMVSDKGDESKSEVFWEQVNETLDFSDACFVDDGGKGYRKISTFHPDWNILQLSTSLKSTNRYGYDLVGKQLVPQLILSAFGFLPNECKLRCEFTTFCSEPPVEPGSQMPHGLIDAFEKLLDNNLTISDDKVVITRKKYWEERRKHNEAIEAIMNAMEEWIFPWTFLFTGTIKNKSIQQIISTEVLSHPILKSCPDSQKFAIYRLTDGYNILPLKCRNIMDTIVAFILRVDENVVQSLTKKIIEIGSLISIVEPRNPTIIILDQDIDILPWDALPCLKTTDVTRMPSLNLINSTLRLTKFVGGSTNCRLIDKTKCTFVLNPDGSLPQVQARLETYFNARNAWTSVVGRSPTVQEMQNSLENQDIFLYCGHGAGNNFYPEHAVQKLICRAIPILMGCSSAQSHFTGPGLYAYSSVHAYFTAGCTSIVGFLWEVTDTECDRITAEFVERWLPHQCAALPKMPLFDSDSIRSHESNLSSALKKSRTAATQLLTQCAAVCYGIPIVKT